MSTHIAIDIRAGRVKNLELLRRIADVLDANNLVLWNLSYNNLGTGIAIQATAENGLVDEGSLRKEFWRLPEVTGVDINIIKE